MTDLTIPQYTPEHYAEMMHTIDPVEVCAEGWSVKRGDAFTLGPLVGSKVRQCLHVVRTEAIPLIEQGLYTGLCTGAGLPSPQTAIVAGVAKYFALPCDVAVPEYTADKHDVQRINASLAQHFGAHVYGVRNVRMSGPDHEAYVLSQENHRFRVKFGMYATAATEPIIRQVQNIPDHVERIVVISGSGLTALSILVGLVRYNKRVRDVHVVTLSEYFKKNHDAWYQHTVQRWHGNLHVVRSEHAYRDLLKRDASIPLDQTYEAKAWDYMTKTFTPDPSTLFWLIGTRVYDLDVITPIQWYHTSREQLKRQPRPTTSETSIPSLD